MKADFNYANVFRSNATYTENYIRYSHMLLTKNNYTGLTLLKTADSIGQASSIMPLKLFLDKNRF